MAGKHSTDVADAIDTLSARIPQLTGLIAVLADASGEDEGDGIDAYAHPVLHLAEELAHEIDGAWEVVQGARLKL